MRMGLEALAAVRAARDDEASWLDAAVLLGAAEGIVERTGIGDDSRHRRDLVALALRDRLGADELAAALGRGRAAPLETILDEHVGAAADAP